MHEMPSDLFKKKAGEMTDFLALVRMIKLNGLEAQIFRVLVDTHNFQPEGLRNKDLEKHMENVPQHKVAAALSRVRGMGLIKTAVNPYSKRERNHSIDPRVFEVMLSLDTSRFQFR